MAEGHKVQGTSEDFRKSAASCSGGTLRAEGHAYRCRCSRKEIADSGLRGIEGIVYPGTCRHLALGRDVAGAERFLVPQGQVEFVDRVQGLVAQDVAHHVNDYSNFTRLLKWGAIICLIVAFLWLWIIKAYW